MIQKLLRGLSMGMAVFAGACSGADSQANDLSITSEQADDARVLDYLLEQGIDLENVLMNGDEVRVDEDILMSRSSILNFLADRREAEEAGGLVDKAYWNSGSPVPAGSVFTIRYDSAVTAAWRNAFHTGASQWNYTDAPCMHFAETTGAAQIVISVGEAGTSATGGNAGAVASFPSCQTHLGCNVGNSIVIDNSIAGGTNVSANFMLNTAMHELGHVLGFTHPRGGRLISGTSSSATGCGSGGCTATYPTVMDYDYVETTTTSDDRNALRTAYRKYPNGRSTGCVGSIAGL